MIFFLALICGVSIWSSQYMTGQIVLDVSGVVLLLGCLFAILLGLKLIHKVFAAPRRWYYKYKNYKKINAYDKIIELYIKYLSGDKLTEYIKFDSVFLDNPLYYLSAFLSNDSEIAKFGYDKLRAYPNGAFFELFYKVNECIAAHKYDNALTLLDYAENTVSKNVWFWKMKFICLINLKQFDLIDDVLKHLKDDEYVFEYAKSKAAAGIDVLKNLEKCYAIKSDNIQIIELYTQALYNNQQKDKAEKIIKQQWKKEPSRLLGELFLKSYNALMPADKFNMISELVMNKPEHVVSQFFIAKVALEAGLFMIARDVLMTLAEHNGNWAYPMLAELERIERNDLQASNKWLIQLAQ